VVQKIDSAALAGMNDAIGIVGPGSQVTELMDGTVEQVIEVGQVVRRSLTPANTTGIFSGALTTIHAGAGDLLAFVSPYDVDPANTFAPWPTPVPRNFDVWLIGASVRRMSGSGTFTGRLDIGTNTAGFAEDNTGAPASFAALVVAVWDSIALLGGLNLGVSPDGHVYQRINLRIPRESLGTDFIGFVSTASALSTYTCALQIGLFPSSLGQDAAV